MSILIYCLIGWMLFGILSVFMCRFYFKSDGVDLTIKEDNGLILFLIIFGMLSFIAMGKIIYKDKDCKNKIKQYVISKFKK